MSISLCRTMKSRIDGRRTAVLFVVLICLIMAGCAREEITPPSDAGAQWNEVGEIEICWKPSKDAQEYRIYRREAGTPDYKFICDVAACSHVDTILITGVTYQYKVTAINQQGESIGVETEIEVPHIQEKQETVQLKAPKIDSITVMDDGTAVIQIEGYDQLCEYEVLRADAVDGIYTVLGSSVDPVFYDKTDDAAEEHFYVARAVKSGEKSENSDPVQTGENAQKVFGVPVLMYHQFLTPEDVENGASLGEYAIWASEFESDLKWLRDNGYTTITSAELVSYMNGAAVLPKKPIILTIDDGWRGVYLNAWPLLKEYNMKAVLAVIGEYMDIATYYPDEDDRIGTYYCTWDELKEMSESGHVEIVSHTQYLHDDEEVVVGRYGANSADGETLEEFLPDAINDSTVFNRRFKEHMGSTAAALAYPYSKRNEVADRAWLFCGYQILYSGNNETDRKTAINYYVYGAGVTADSAVTRRIARMQGASIEEYLNYAYSN